MQDQDHVYKTKTSIFVLEEPRDQDHGLEDYNTGLVRYFHVPQMAEQKIYSECQLRYDTHRQ